MHSKWGDRQLWGGRETNSSWLGLCWGDMEATHQGTVFLGARWTLTKPLQPQVWLLGHMEDLEPF